MSRAALALWVLVLLAAGSGGTPSDAGVLAHRASALSAAALAPADTTDEPNAEARRFLVRGMTRAYVGDYAEAIALYEQALERAPNEATILSALADAHAAQDDPTTALFYARQARDRAPTNPHYHLELARLQKTAGRIDDALATYRAALDRFPDAPTARRELAQTQADAGRTRAAITTYEPLVDGRTPAAPEAWQALLRLYRQVDDASGIEQALNALMELRPADPTYPQMLGNLYLRTSRIDAAIDLYERQLTAPPDVETLSTLAMLYRRADQPGRADSLLRRYTDDASATVEQLVERARSLSQDALTSPSTADSGLVQTATRLLRTALDRAPNHAAALALLGELRYEAGAYAEAGNLLDRTLQQNPRAPKRWILAASAHFRADSLQRAVDVAEEGLLLFPGQLPLVRISANALLDLDRPTDARDRLTDALNARDDAPAAQRASLLSVLGRAYNQLGTPAASTDAFETALELAPDDPSIAGAFALVLAKRKAQLDRALRLARRAADQAPNDPRVLDALGWVQYQLGSLQEARTALEAAVETGTAPARAYAHLGDVHAALGNDADARRYWQAALERAPDSSDVRTKLDSLEQ